MKWQGSGHLQTGLHGREQRLDLFELLTERRPVGIVEIEAG